MKPRSEQIRFNSANHGEVNLDAYLEAAEKGGRALADLLSDIFSEAGEFRSDMIDFREDPDDVGMFQFRVGDFSDDETGWRPFNATNLLDFVDLCSDHADAASASATSASASKDAASASASAASGSASAANSAKLDAESAKSAAQTAQTHAANAKTAAEAARDKAQDWANKDVDTQVETGQYSAKHYASKALASQTAASLSAELAGVYASQATDAIEGVALLNSPAFTGTPTAPTPTTSDNSTRVATTAHVKAAIASAVTGYLPYTGGIMIGRLETAASTDAAAGFSIPVGTAPTTPIDGDIWATTASLLMRINGSTRTFYHNGNLATISQSEAEAGTATTARAFTAQRIAQAIAAAPVNAAVLAALADKFDKAGGTITGTTTFSDGLTVTGTFNANGAASFGSTMAVAGAATFSSTVALNGTSTTATQTAGNNSTRIATTAFVTTAVANGIATRAATSHTHAIADVTDLQTSLDAKAPLASPALTGTPTAPTATSGTDSNQIATTAFVTTAVSSKADASDITGIAKLTVEDQTLTGGARVSSKNLGTISSGTVTPDPGDRPLQHYSNNGAHTLAPGTSRGSYLLDITNGASAGAITISGWTKKAGDNFTTTSGHKFRAHCSVGQSGSLIVIQAMQ